MRRTDREVTDFHEIADILRRCDTIRLGMNGDPYPYVVPLSFGFEAADGKISVYFHGAKEGHKHDLIDRDNRVCVEASICHRFVTVPGSATVEYESFIGFGRAVVVDGEEAVKGLDLMLEHCGFEGLAYDRALLAKTAVYKIELASFTGKRRMV